MINIIILTIYINYKLKNKLLVIIKYKKIKIYIIKIYKLYKLTFSIY